MGYKFLWPHLVTFLLFSQLLIWACTEILEPNNNDEYYSPYAANCWWLLFSYFKVNWVFGDAFGENVCQILSGPALKEGPRLIWVNTVKALPAEIWFKQNQRVFHDKKLKWMDWFEAARLNASSWCILSKTFEDFSIQDLCLN